MFWLTKERPLRLSQHFAGVAALGSNRPGSLSQLHASILAEAQSALGDTATAIVTMEDALRTAQAQEERWALAAHQCLLGDLYNRLTPAKEELAERMLLSAIVTARTQRARSLELRAATSLARLWAERGERHRAHSLLAPIFGWFTEGFDTPDLQEARMLLNELASDPCTGPQF